MKLLLPFFISARLAPAIKVADARLSYESNGGFFLDFANGETHVISEFRFPQGRVRGTTDENALQDGFSAVLSFLSACAESRNYAERTKGDAMAGENSNLFPDWVGQWAQDNSDEIELARFGCDRHESGAAILPDNS